METGHLRFQMERPICYLTGPITGVDNYRQVFAEYAQALTKRGYNVINPAALDGDEHPNWIAAMKRDIKLVCDVDVLAVMPDWKNSAGARFEVDVAFRLGIPIIDATTTRPIPQVKLHY